MKVVVTASGPTLDDQVDAACGRSRYFLFVETDDLSCEALQNPHASVEGCVGPATAELFINKGTQVVLTGLCGPNAYLPLEAAGVTVIKGLSGKVREVIEQFKKGELSPMTKEEELRFLKAHESFWGRMFEVGTKQLHEAEQELEKA